VRCEDRRSILRYEGEAEARTTNMLYWLEKKVPTPRLSTKK
jgi:hypothetical protein